MSDKLPATVDFESNPFRIQLPDALKQIPDVETYLRNLMESLRKTHNVEQAGDSMTPWMEMTRVTQTPLHTPGAEGRFIHPKYGIIRGRYGQFTGVLVSDSGVPIGHAKAPDGFKWELTNDLTAMDIPLAAGLQAGYIAPANGSYGWVITFGINLQSLDFLGDSAPTVGMAVNWYATGFVGAADGPRIGYLANVTGLALIASNHWRIPPASMLVSCL